MKAIVVRKSSKGFLPPGMILYWSGSSNQLPTGWSLVDYQAGAYIMGTIPSGISYAISGSASHTHTVANTASGGAHKHAINATIDSNVSKVKVSQQLQDATGVGEHFHPITSSMPNGGVHSHTVSNLSSASNMPLTVKFWMMKSQGAAIPIGAIALWSGILSTIPTGWRHCDGSTIDGITVPEIKERYLANPTTNSDVGMKSGLYMHTHNPPTNTGIAGTHEHNISVSVGINMEYARVYAGSSVTMADWYHAHGNHTVITNNTGDHLHTLPNVDEIGTLMPYIQLYYIIKVF
ncbi:MAG: hypothetical protein ACOX8S_12450 [Christensenellales bacterium]|jgi:hypothetical protein